MKKTQSLFAILLVASLFSSSLLAELPSWYPQDYDMVGIVDEVNEKTIYIDDNKISISPTVKYATENNSNASIRQLKKGLLVGVNILTINNRNLVDRIWLIPESQRKKYQPLQ